MLLLQARLRRRVGIPAQQYSKEYFLSDQCEGYREYVEGGGVSHVKAKLVERVSPQAGERVLEIGSGRGEVLRACAERGARPVGIDYAREAVALTRQICADSADVMQADATALPFREKSFSKVFLGDVLEHLTSRQASQMLAESFRVLGPGGILVLHTSPNVLFVRLVFPWVMLALLLTGRVALWRALLAQYRTIRRFHVLEYSAGRLRRLFERSPFQGARVACDPDLLRGGNSRYTASIAQSRLVQAIARIASSEPWVRVFSNDLWVIARKPA